MARESHTLMVRGDCDDLCRRVFVNLYQEAWLIELSFSVGDEF